MDKLESMRRTIPMNPNIKVLNNMFEQVRHIDDVKDLLENTAFIKKYALRGMSDAKKKQDERFEYKELFDKCLLLEAPHLFESYLVYMEKNRHPSKKFYMPRRKTLKILVQDYQDVADGVIDFLGISMPPRTGKSTLGIFYMTWQMGRFPDRANIMSGHSSPLTQGFYDEAISLIEGSEYTYGEIFPNTSIHTSAKYTTIDLNKSRRFSTLTCRAIGATLTGATEAGNCLYTDDLVEDLEEAINPERMQAKFDAYSNQLKDRMTDGAHQVMVGTRWSEDDPLGRLRDIYEDDPRYRFRVVPALIYDENGEPHSNFAYDVNGFSTEYYLDMKKTIDDNTFMAKYQGEPYSRHGLLFEKEQFDWYDGREFDLEKIDGTYSVTDIAWGGGDDLVTLIAIEKDDNIYIHDVYISNKDKDVTRPNVTNLLATYRPTIAQFEANNGGHEYKDRVDEELNKRGLRLNTRAKTTSSAKSKLSRIIQYSPEVRTYILRSDPKRGSMYDYMLMMLFRFTQSGKNKHDDVPDAFAMLAEMLSQRNSGKIEPFTRTWF